MERTLQTGIFFQKGAIMKQLMLKIFTIIKTSPIRAMLLLATLAIFISPKLAFSQEKPQITENPIYATPNNDNWQSCEGLPGCKFIQLRGNPKKEASEAIFRLDASVRFPKHWHTSPEHIVGIKGRLVINLENGDTFTVGSGEFLYNLGGMIHWGHCSEEEPCLYYVYDDKPYDIYLVE